MFIILFYKFIKFIMNKYKKQNNINRELHIIRKLPPKYITWLKNHNKDYVFDKFIEIDKKSKEIKHSNDLHVIGPKARDVIIGYYFILNDTVPQLLNTWLNKTADKIHTSNLRYNYSDEFFEYDYIKQRYNLKDYDIIDNFVNFADHNNIISKNEIEAKIGSYLSYGKAKFTQNGNFKIIELKDVISALMIIYLYDDMKNEFLKQVNITEIDMKEIITNLLIIKILRDNYEHKKYENLTKEEHSKCIKLCKEKTLQTLKLFPIPS